MFLSLPWPKTLLFTVFLSLLSKNTAICDVFKNVAAKNAAICEVFLRFRAKTSSLGNLQKHSKNQCFCPAKTAKTVAQTAPKSQNLVPRPPDKRHETKNVLKPKIEDQMSKNSMFLNVYLADSGRAHAVTSPFRAVKQSIFLIPPSRPIKNSRFWPRKGSPPPQVNLTLQLLMPGGFHHFSLWIFMVEFRFRHMCMCWKACAASAGSCNRCQPFLAAFLQLMQVALKP